LDALAAMQAVLVKLDFCVFLVIGISMAMIRKKIVE
jgi:hypothetical protein